MKFYLLAMPFPARRDELLAGVRMAGADPVRFRRMLDLVVQTAKIAEEGGIEGVAFSEQHSNIEGLPEVTTNPILFDALVGGNTSRIKVGQLGVTLSSHHPLRVAEDLAMLDQMTNGRAFCAFARGNSARWVNTLGHAYGTTITHSNKDEADERNMRAIKEAWAIIKRAWTNDTFSYDGEFWSVPAPGITWDSALTRKYGAGVEEDGRLTAMGIVPRPLQQPHPRLFSPLAFRMSTALFWISEGATAVCFAAKTEFLRTAFDVLSERAAEVGSPYAARPLAPAGLLIVGKDRAAVDKLRAEHEWLSANVFAAPPYKVPMARAIVGTPDEVSRQIEELTDVFPFEEMFLWHNIGFHDQALEESSLELFLQHVAPRFV